MVWSDMLYMYIVLVIYDHLLTLYLEISEIWPKKLSLVKCLFLMSRYSLLLLQIFATIYTFPYSKVNDEVSDISFRRNNG